jgi:Tfp pilus assembly protein PilX
MRRTTRHTLGGDRRGSALILVLVLTVAVAALALSAVALTGHTGLVTRYYDREQEFRYASEAALAMGKSRLNTDSYALPDSGFVTLMAGEAIMGADGQALENLSAYLYAGPSGSTSGQFGRFASVVSEVRDPSGSRFVRRLELAQESFAKFA